LVNNGRIKDDQIDLGVENPELNGRVNANANANPREETIVDS
jgi:hypothetical protein